MQETTTTSPDQALWGYLSLAALSQSLEALKSTSVSGSDRLNAFEASYNATVANYRAGGSVTEAIFALTEEAASLRVSSN